MGKCPSPCIDVCKYKLKGHCIACSMTKAQKKGWKQLERTREQREFLDMLIKQQNLLRGKFKAWRIAYAAKCARKGVDSPL